MMFLRQSTAVDIGIGPFVDATDGVTAETGLTISQADVRLKKNNGAWAQVNDNTSATHEENGWYEKELDATDTNTVGILLIAVNESGALPVWQEYQVVEEAVYDALFAASAPGYGTAQTGDSFARLGAPAGASISADVAGVQSDTNDIQTRIPAALVGGRIDANVGAISGDATAADNLETLLDDTAGPVPWMGILDQGTAQSATGNDIVLRAGNSHANDTLIGATIMVLGSTQGYWQSALISDHVNATDTVTVTPNAGYVTPSGTITYKIFATAASSGGSGLDAAGVRAAVGLASANLDTQLSGLDTKLDTIDNFLDTEVAAILADTNELQTDWADGGRLDLILDARASQTSVNTIDDLLDTEMPALTTAVADLPTNAELATALGTADDAVLAAIAALNNLSAAQVNTEVDTAIQDAFNFSNGNVNANVEEINTVTITGDGQVGSEFGV